MLTIGSVLTTNVSQTYPCKLHYSVMKGVVPDKSKNSNIVPTPKSANRTQASNYRPISLLSILSKILEKYSYNLIFTHVELFCPLSPNHAMGVSTW